MEMRSIWDEDEEDGFDAEEMGMEKEGNERVDGSRREESHSNAKGKGKGREMVGEKSHGIEHSGRDMLFAVEYVKIVLGTAYEPRFNVSVMHSLSQMRDASVRDEKLIAQTFLVIDESLACSFRWNPA